MTRFIVPAPRQAGLTRINAEVLSAHADHAARKGSKRSSRAKLAIEGKVPVALEQVLQRGKARASISCGTPGG